MAASIVQGARSKLGNRLPLLVCGGSKGVALFTNEMKWSSDGITDGRFIFAGVDNDPDVIFQDAYREFISSKEDGGMVTHYAGKPGGLGMWLVVYAETGVTETHNLIQLDSGQIMDLWTVNKPGMTVPANAKLFTSFCTRP
ncbi:hypothetical protein ACFSCW_09720 [Sphingomonas tabacisoli]|uniref:Uncharacterized protein n=1 Tax=Sphingomonas tabacisoli TaxID=2249466 RepID=A0ABW4I4D6_9SPHN